MAETGQCSVNFATLSAKHPVFTPNTLNQGSILLNLGNSRGEDEKS